ncbi:MAG: MMPL family transporter [Myxococcota bacterium]
MHGTESLAGFVTTRRVAVVVVTLLLTSLAAFFALNVEMDPSPKSLVVSFQDQEEAQRLVHENFGNTDYVVAILVNAEDVLDDEVLSYIDRLSRHFQEESYVERVESITHSALAVHEMHEEPTNLDQLEEHQEPEFDPELVFALHALANAEPERYPEGAHSLAQTAQQVRMVRLGDGAEELRSALLQNSLVEGRLVSPSDAEGRRALAVVALFLASSVDDHRALAEAARAVDAELLSLPPPPGVHTVAGGLPHVWVEIVEQMERDQVVLVPLMLVVCMVFLTFAFRWWPATVLPIVTVGVTAALIVGGMGAINEPLNILNNIIPPLLIIIGVSDSIHLIGRYREELRRGLSPVHAMRTTVKSMAVACLLTSATTAVGLMALLVSETDMMRRFGVTAAIGVMTAYLVTIFFLPATLLHFKPRFGQERSDRGDVLERVVTGVARAVIHRPWPVLAIALVFAGVASASAALVEVDTALLDQFDEDDQVYQTTRLLERELDGVRPLEAVFQAKGDHKTTDPEFLNALDRTTQWAREQEGVLRAHSGADVLHEAWFVLSGDPGVRNLPFRTEEQVNGLRRLTEARTQATGDKDPMRGYITPDAELARLEVRVADIGAQATMKIIDDFEQQLRHELGPLADEYAVHLTGDAYTGSVPIDAVARDMISSLAVAALIIFVMLGVLFRSVRLGLLAVPPNALPLLLAVGWMVLRGFPLNIATAIIFAISLGLAVDGTIHMLARFQEERRGGVDLDTALLNSARGTGRAIVVSSISLFFGFSVLMFSGFVPVRYFGELVAVTVAGCLVSTLIVQPALLKVGAGPVRPAADTRER